MPPPRRVPPLPRQARDPKEPAPASALLTAAATRVARAGDQREASSPEARSPEISSRGVSGSGEFDLLDGLENEELTDEIELDGSELSATGIDGEEHGEALELEDLEETPAARRPPVPSLALSVADLRAKEAHELVAAAKTGDPRAFEALVRRYRHRIFALALHMTGSKSDADDITQDAFVRAYRNIDRFEGRSEFFTWLYRIALNRALNVRRDRTRRRTQDLDDPRVTVAVAVDSGGDPHRAIELRQTYGYLVRAFDRLSPLLKTTVALTMMQGLSYPEAAVVLETTEGTIAWRIHEARKQMRAALDSMFNDPVFAKAQLAKGQIAKDGTPLAANLERARARLAGAREGDGKDGEGPTALEMALALLAPTV